MSDPTAERMAQYHAHIRAQRLAKLWVDADLYHEAAITRVAVASFEPIKAELEKSLKVAVFTGVFLANVAIGIFAFIFGMLMAGVQV